MGTYKPAEALYVQLKNSSTLASLVSTRIYPVVAPIEADYPRITYQLISETPSHAMGGDVSKRDPYFQIDIWAESYTGMESVGNQVMTCLQDFSGTITSGSSSLAVDRIFLEGQMDLPDYDDSKKKTIYRRMQEYIIWY